MSSHKYWRLLIYQNNGDSFYLSIYSMDMFDVDGNLLSSGGTASASQKSANAGLVFDGNLTTRWILATTVGDTLPTLAAPAWVQYTFAGPVEVAVVRLYCADGTPSPNLFKLQYSDNGTTWSDATGNITPLIWNTIPSDNPVCWSFTTTTTTIPGGTFVNWRVVCSTPPGGSYVGCAEFNMRETAGGSSAFGSSSFAIASRDMCSNHGPLANAFDGNLTTYIQSGAGATPFIGYAFNRPLRIAEVDWTAPPGSIYAAVDVGTLSLQGSNDCGMTWTTIANFTAAPWTAPNQLQIFGVPLDQNGNIAYSQIRLPHRNGAGHQFQMFGGGSTRTGGGVMWDAQANIVDAGGQSVVRSTAIPPASSSAGTPGQIAIDGAGNLYVCYATNLWMKFTGAAF